MANFQDSYLSGGNIDFIEGLYARYLEDPSSVDPSWRELFERNDGAGRPIFNKTLIEPPAPVVPGKEGKGRARARARATRRPPRWRWPPRRPPPSPSSRT